MAAPRLPTYIRILGVHLLAGVFIVAVLASLVSTASYYMLAGGRRVVGEIVSVGRARGCMLVISSARASTPVTSLVSVNTTRLEGVPGVVAVSQEILVPVLIKGRGAVVLRGVTQVFTRLYRLRVVDGRGFDGRCLYCLWLGEEAARRSGLRVGDVVEVESFFTNTVFHMVVAGVYRSGSVLDDEAIASIIVARRLRGAPASSATLVRVLYDCSPRTRSLVLGAVGSGGAGGGSREKPPLYIIERSVSLVVSSGGRITVSEAGGGIADVYLRRLGVSPELLLAVSAAVSIVSCYSLFAAGVFVSVVRKRRIRILYEQGASMPRVLARLAAVLAPAVLLGCTVGYALAVAILEASPPRLFLAYTIRPWLDPIAPAIVVGASLVLVLAGLLRAGALDGP